MGRGVGSRVTGRILKKGREERNPAARLGRCQRSRAEREVGWEEQENTWDVVSKAELQEGYRRKVERREIQLPGQVGTKGQGRRRESGGRNRIHGAGCGAELQEGY